MSEPAVGCEKYVHIDQYHEDAGTVHDMNVHAGVLEATEYAGQHPVTRDQQGNHAKPHPQKKQPEYLYP